jgi:hypothetical protein
MKVRGKIVCSALALGIILTAYYLGFRDEKPKHDSVRDTNDQHMRRKDSIVKSRTYGDRVTDAIVGFIIGIVLFFFSFAFSFAIEKFVVTRWLVSRRAKRACVCDISPISVNRNLNCRMVHMTGDMQAVDPIRDDLVGFSSKETAVVLKRTVEVFQWHEHSKTEKERTIYTYELKWSESDIDSAKFHQEAGHKNPTRPIPSLHSSPLYAHVNVGAYKMSQEQLEKCKRWHPSDPTDDDLPMISSRITSPPDGYHFAGIHAGERMTRIEGQTVSRGESYWSSIFEEAKLLPRKFIYIKCSSDSHDGVHGDTSTTCVGDIRVSYDVIREGPVSLVGILQDDTFRAFSERDAHMISGRCDSCPERLPSKP